jgi:phenylacetate-CoA ligase
VQNLKSELHRPDAIISAAETLSENTRQYVEEIFQCPVVNLYGSREAGLIACECLKKEGLHIASLHTKVEILTDDLRPSSPGQIGNIYITTLDNYSMPLIRYRIGDTAVPTDKTCSCGNPHPLIEKITGRQMEVFKTRKGTVVPGEFFIHYIGVVCNKGYVKKFQVIQKDYEHIIVKAVVIDVKQFNDSKEHLVSLIRKVMGTSCNVEFMLVEDIPLTKSGKFQYTISEI